MTIQHPPLKAIEEFKRLFHSTPRIFRAPGRINLIGEHTDYNDGFVMPAAIDFATWVAAEARNDRKVVARSLAFDSTVEFDLEESDALSAPGWSRLVRALTSTLAKRGGPINGTNLVIEGDVPMGAGLSSSASVEVALATCFVALSRMKISSKEIALAAQAAEIESTGARVGIMDQFVSVHGEQGKVLLLDCRSLEYEAEPLPENLQLVICNTMIKHSIAGSEYNQRRAECEEGVRILSQTWPGIKALRDVTMDKLEAKRGELSAVVYRRCRHVITENDRVHAMASALKQDNEQAIGQLMRASHQSLRENYEVSCPELDAMVEAASDAPGGIGSRMTGGGFGGCTVNLVRKGEVDKFKKQVAAKYQSATGIIPEIFVTGTSAGASEWKLGEVSLEEKA
jgi:galactokinase